MACTLFQFREIVLQWKKGQKRNERNGKEKGKHTRREPRKADHRTVQTKKCSRYAGRFAPLVLEQNQVVHSFFLADSLIYFLEVSHQLLDVFVAYKFCAWAYLMNDATLDLCVRKSRFNSLSETCQTVNAEQKYIFKFHGFWARSTHSTKIYCSHFRQSICREYLSARQDWCPKLHTQPSWYTDDFPWLCNRLHP